MHDLQLKDLTADSRRQLLALLERGQTQLQNGVTSMSVWDAGKATLRQAAKTQGKTEETLPEPVSWTVNADYISHALAVPSQISMTKTVLPPAARNTRDAGTTVAHVLPDEHQPRSSDLKAQQSETSPAGGVHHG